MTRISQRTPLSLRFHCFGQKKKARKLRSPPSLLVYIHSPMLWQWPLPPQTIDPRRPPQTIDPRRPPPPPPPMDPSLSKCASDVVSESLILRNVSSPNDATGCNDPSISRQTLVTEMLKFSLQQLLKSEEYFPEEFLVQDFNCAFQDSILFQGHMYLFAHFICFYSNIFGFETKKIIAFNEIKSVKKAKTAGIFSNAIEIFAGGRKYFFTSFISRDEAYELINDGWVQHGNGGNEITEQQELMLESCSKENGFVAIEKG